LSTTGIERRDRTAGHLKSECLAASLKRDGRVLFVSSAGSHGDGSGAQQAKDAVPGFVAPVLRVRDRLSDDPSRTAKKTTEMAGSFSRDSVLRTSALANERATG
jgi:hypothetical protein